MFFKNVQYFTHTLSKNFPKNEICAMWYHIFQTLNTLLSYIDKINKSVFKYPKTTYVILNLEMVDKLRESFFKIF